MSLFSRPTVILSAILIAGSALAAGHGSPEDIHKMRNANMKEIGKNMGVLGNMVKGSSDYDAAAAKAAAGELVTLASVDLDAFWAEGSSSDEVATSRAKPEIWANLDDLKSKHQAMIDAAIALEAVAGDGLEQMQTAFGPMGGSCGDCHKAYRGPKP